MATRAILTLSNRLHAFLHKTHPWSNPVVLVFGTVKTGMLCCGELGPGPSLPECPGYHDEYRQSVTSAEAADRLAIRELVDAYAHYADGRDATGQMALFTEDTRFVVYMEARNPEPTQDLHGREALAPVFDVLNAYAATMHFNGQSTIELAGDRVTGESYRLAHHPTEAEDGSRTLMVASIRYLDTFVK
jgi:SnoaL-like domain